MEKINIAKLLKDCPKGMELYSPLCGKCVFDRLNFGTIICKKQNTQEITFTCEGYYMLPVFDNCECMIFPSKDQRDWSKFQRPFKDGDVVATALGSQAFILQKATNARQGYCYMGYDFEFDKFFGTGEWVFDRLATEEEKQKLFQAIKEHGYKWNPEIKTLEKLPKFRVGDRIKKKDFNEDIVLIVDIANNYYIVETKYGMEISISTGIQDNYELVPNKFDIATLVPLESKVLVRDCDQYEWEGEIFTRYAKSFNSCNFITLGGQSWKQCIPYNDGTKHLLGKTDDCDDFYKTWE